MSDEKHPWIIYLHFLAIEFRSEQEKYQETPTDLFYVVGDKKVLTVKGNLPIPYLPDWTHFSWVGSVNASNTFQLKTTQIYLGGRSRRHREMVTTYSGNAYNPPLLKQEGWDLDEARQQQDTECQRFTEDWLWDGFDKNEITVELLSDWKGSSHRFTTHQEPFERQFGAKNFLKTRQQFEEEGD